MNIKKILVIILIIIPLISFAFEIDSSQIKSFGFSELITWIYYGLLIFSVGITFGVIIYGGIEYMTSAGDPKKMQSGINRIQDSAIGVLLIMISYLILSTINPQLLLLKDPVITKFDEEEIDIPDAWPDLCFLFPGACEEGGSYPGGPVPIYPGGEPSKNIDPNQIIPYGWPAKGGITSRYGMRSDPFGRGLKFHRGVDIAGAYGDGIYATAKGIVVFAGWKKSYGNVIYINHPSGYQTCYAHLSAFAVSEGQEVFGGQNIGFMGNSGSVYPKPTSKKPYAGTHLHYEILLKGDSINPEFYLRK